MMIVDLIKLLLVIQRIVETLIQAQANKVQEDAREKLHEAIEDAKRAKTDEERRDALRRVQDAFKTKR